jgi:hypothetical protein
MKMVNKSNTVIRRNKNTGNWLLIDKSSDREYVIDVQKTPAEIRRAKRRWWLYLTVPDAERAWAILEGEVEVK